MSTLIEKLNPARFSDMSPKMAAIVGCILDQEWTSPRLVELVVTSDGHVLGMQEGDCGHNEFIGSRFDLKRNWNTLLEAAELTEEEREEAQELYLRKLRSVS